MEKDAKIYIAGHRGMVGSAISRHLLSKGYSNIVTRSSKDLDLREQGNVRAFFDLERPDYVFLSAAKVGGILANNVYRAEFLYDNLMIAANVIDAAHQFGVSKLMFLGSSCIYPKMASQPLKEEYLLSGRLEETNEPYAVAKIAGIKMCEAYASQYGCNFISVMPTNLYGRGDNYDLENSHVLPALIRKFHEAVVNDAATVTVWGTGTPRREFLFADDLADACVFLMDKYNGKEIINIGTGEDVSIRELAGLVADVVGFRGGIGLDLSKPDGAPRKLMDVSRLHGFGWRHKVGLKEGVQRAYTDFLSSKVACDDEILN